MTRFVDLLLDKKWKAENEKKKRLRMKKGFIRGILGLACWKYSFVTSLFHSQPWLHDIII
jgi:hypothetical protein